MCVVCVCPPPLLCPPQHNEAVRSAAAGAEETAAGCRLPPPALSCSQTMGMAAEEEHAASPREEEWPEAEKAEKLARGAALKWASGVFYRPEKLEGLGQYRSRETQRNSSIQSRLKSTVQSYLEGVSVGLEQLRSAVQEVQSVCQEMGAARWALLDSQDQLQGLQQMRVLMAEHVQLASVVQVLPQLFSVQEVFSHTLQLLRGQQLLEAHVELMMVEQLRDDILSQLHLRGLSSAQTTVLSYFSGLQEINESLAKQLWDITGSSLQLVREDPVLFVTAVRIIEREEKIDDTLLLEATFLPPGRPKGWRQKFYHILQETITGSLFRAARVKTEGSGLARHLAALQKDIVSELRVVKDLMVQCVPAHYNILSLCTATYHQALTSHLQDILRENLDKQALFLLLEWALHVYHSPEMMGHPDLLPEVDVSDLGPLMSPELVDQTERKYVVKVKASVLEWMQRTLEVEFKEWFREEEPEMDHQGFFQSALPVIIMQMLNENIQVASLINDSLQQKVYNMALEELEAFLGRSVEPLALLPTLPAPGFPGQAPQADGGDPQWGTHLPHRRISSLSACGATVTALWATSSHGLLPKCFSSTSESCFPQGSRTGPSAPACAGQKKEPSELGGWWEVHMAPGAAQLQVLVPGCPWLCCSLREALVHCGKEHQKDRAVPKHYISYLLAMLNNNLALSSSVSSLHPDTACREVPVSLQAALDRTQKKACQLLLEEMLLDLQPLCLQLPSRKWLSSSQLVTSICEVIDKYAKDFSRVRKPIFTVLLAESELLVSSQYLRALMQKKMVCRSKEERAQLCDRLLQDATQLRELFSGLGLERQQQSLEAVFALRELICLKDPALLSLEVLGFITKYPDVSDEHISTLLDLRGDVSRDVRHMVLEMMEQNPQVLPESYQPIFSTILVPAPELPFCLRKGKCT
ncbi:exocyst complex component 3-like protein isoform X2 [Heliangelus exortis]|uniref:exocyst complex component 3-like protein isoform X2 n=1 Tax=Heliangelus exortis TaxID=472823 RepID=UPI003A904E7A